MERFDVIVVGAGLLGCFTARALAAYELDVAVFEAREDVCTGVSRANTGIVYTGCDTKPGTLKTELTVRANARFDELCAELDVPFRRCGSLMAAFGPRAEAVLDEKFENGRRNGVPGLELLGREDALALEPGLSPRVTRGLWAPGTGTVNPWELGVAAFENARENGVRFRFGESVERLARRADGFAVVTAAGEYSARAVVNCAGLAADRVRELAARPLLRLFPDGADYLVLDAGSDRFLRHILFHEPEQRGKGLTLVPTVDGNVLVGPTERPLDGAGYGAASVPGLAELRRLCGEVFPALPLDETIRSFAARRPNPYYVRETAEGWAREARGISSFTLLEEVGLFSLIGIKTPGLTCAAELGQYVTARLLAHLGGAARRRDFTPARRGIPRVRELDEAARAALIAEDGAWGRLVCRCRGVTEGEVLAAIRRGAVTLDGVKRRVGTAMGRCQGAWCTQTVLELLARELHIPPEAVTKDGAGSELLRGSGHGES